MCVCVCVCVCVYILERPNRRFDEPSQKREARIYTHPRASQLRLTKNPCQGRRLSTLEASWKEPTEPLFYKGRERLGYKTSNRAPPPIYK